MPDPLYTFDLDRILFGKLPWLYLVEILLRTTVIYCFALMVVRLLGKRGMGQLAPFDFVIIIALGSAVGDPMFYPDVPLLHAVAAIVAIVVFTRTVVFLTQRFGRVRRFLEATTSRLVCDGVMDLDAMRREGIAREELFSSLRASDTDQLGAVERAYLEPSGAITLIRRPAASHPGLPLLPETEKKLLRIHAAGETVLAGGAFSCWACGQVKDIPTGASFPECPNCHGKEWVRAVTEAHLALAAARR